MKDELVAKVMEEVLQKMTVSECCDKQQSTASKCNLTEFIGTGIGDTIGLVIANLDTQIRQLMGIDEKFHSIGIVGSRTGAGPHIFAADEGVKSSNTEIVKIELARDTKGGAGHGSLIIFGSGDVSDVKRAVEVTLATLEKTFGDVYGNDAGHLEFQYSARASYALNKAFNAPLGKAFGITVGAPAAIGVLLADTASKSATIDVNGFSSPSNGTCFSNEVIATFSGDSGAVKQAIIAARDVGLQLLGVMDHNNELKSSTKPYII